MSSYCHKAFARVHFISTRILTCINSLLATILNFNLSLFLSSFGINGIAHSRVHPKVNLLQQKIRDCYSFLLNTFPYENSAFECTLPVRNHCALFIIHVTCVQDDPLHIASSWFASTSRYSSMTIRKVIYTYFS